MIHLGKYVFSKDQIKSIIKEFIRVRTRIEIPQYTELHQPYYYNSEGIDLETYISGFHFLINNSINRFNVSISMQKQENVRNIYDDKSAIIYNSKSSWPLSSFLNDPSHNDEYNPSDGYIDQANQLLKNYGLVAVDEVDVIIVTMNVKHIPHIKIIISVSKALDHLVSALRFIEIGSTRDYDSSNTRIYVSDKLKKRHDIFRHMIILDPSIQYSPTFYFGNVAPTYDGMQTRFYIDESQDDLNSIL